MRIRRVDRNQPEIVAALRKCGFTVNHTHMVGNGFPDLCISRNGYTHLIEIKDGALPPHLRRLTPLESEFFTKDQGSNHKVESIDDVFDLSKKLP